MDRMAHQLIGTLQDLERLERQMEKLTAAWPSISMPGSQRNGTAARQSVAELETLLLSDAEMVFSTLSSTQRKIFKDSCVRAPFHTVLIDEAGQASEVAVLQPMTAGAKSIVLVGDPQQLPATIKSEAAKAVEMERSLFERLQMKGCPVALLSIQYRMHPEIRRFPSRHFYKDQLQDALSVSRLQPESYHGIPCLGPYQVFDVASGKEERSKTSSLSNAEEAKIAACLFMKLQKATTKTQPSADTLPSVAVITPYRQQKNVLRRTFKQLCGEDSLQRVSIETIDSYQGRQVDVVILSCVRAGTGGGLGFVNDVRRMNVAITRARRSLWILGALGTLKKNKEWDSLIQDAESRNLIISHQQALNTLGDELAILESAEKTKVKEVHAKQQQPQQPREMTGVSAKTLGSGSRTGGNPMKKAELSNTPMVPNQPQPMARGQSQAHAMKKAGTQSDPINSSKPMVKHLTVLPMTCPNADPRKAHESAQPRGGDGSRVRPAADISAGIQKLEECLQLMNHVTGQEEPNPFDPEKPSAARGKSAKRRKTRQGGRDELTTNQFRVSKKYPQLPDGR
jgi:hypothetical protein